jgi:hypothetical protein
MTLTAVALNNRIKSGVTSSDTTYLPSSLMIGRLINEAVSTAKVIQRPLKWKDDREKRVNKNLE